MNVEFFVTNCENDQLCGDYEQLRPRANTVHGHDILCSSSSVPYSLGGGASREPLVSRDPQTSSLDRHIPPSSSLFYLSPKPQRKGLPFLSKLKKGRSKSAHSSPSHAAARPAAISEVQDVDSCDSGYPIEIESNLDFGFRGEPCWTGSNESFSDLDAGMTRMTSPHHQFRARSLSCSSYSQTDNELSRSRESIPSVSNQLAGPTLDAVTICNFLRKSCENVYDTTPTPPPRKHNSLPTSRNARSKSSGGLMIQKFSKKLSKFSLGSGGGGGGTKGGEGSGGSTKKKKGRTNSASQLEGGDG